MISVKSAIESIENTVQTAKGTTELPLAQALGYVLAENVYGKIDLPPFRQSAMDGYALKIHQNLKYEVIGEIAAGSSLNPELKPGQAVRIFTGAPVPDSADSIVIQERVVRNADHINLEFAPLPKANIRPMGEQQKAGSYLLPENHRLTPAGIGLLASAGVTTVNVRTKPRVCIVVTGDELMPPGVKLNYGQIYESNGLMLQSVLWQKGYDEVKVVKAKDDFEVLKNTLSDAFANSDIVLVSGGISVGDYDFAESALGALGVQQVFYKVKQKPGKPLFFGTKEDKLVFALPGNPASALSCFYSYVLLALRLWEGDLQAQNPLRKAHSKFSFSKKGDRPQFLKARVEGEQLSILDGQASSMLKSFAAANALVYLDETISEVEQGQLIPYLKID